MQTDPLKETEGPQKLPETYNICKGDRLLSIVNKLIPGLTFRQRLYACFILKTENPDIIRNINLIHPGKTLRIPNDFAERIQQETFDPKKLAREFTKENERFKKRIFSKTRLKLLGLTAQATPPELTPKPALETTKPNPKTGSEPAKDTKETPNPYFAFSTREFARMKRYTGAFDLERHSDVQISRTFNHRLDDHIQLLRDIKGNHTPELESLNRALFATQTTSLFIDIGPGLANVAAPAVTSREIAEAFPAIHVLALDLPEEVAKFESKVPQEKRDELLATKNLTVISGDGLKSLREQIKDTPLPAGAPIMIRAANSIDIYCEWKDVEPALVRMAQDFQDHPVLLLFNREILLKPQNSTAWSIVGQVNERGFRHRTQNLRRNGEPYKLKPISKSPAMTEKPRPGKQAILQESRDFPPETPEYIKPSILKLERFGLKQDEYGIVVDVPTQNLFLVCNRKVKRKYPVSTGKRGVGIAARSSKTPPGVHRIDRKAGDGLAIGQRVKDGKQIQVSSEHDDTQTAANVITRAMYIRGLEQKINTGQNIPRRPIAIHGTEHEGLIGQPASHGCIRMKNTDVVELFELVDKNTLIDISDRQEERMA